VQRRLYSQATSHQNKVSDINIFFNSVILASSRGKTNGNTWVPKNKEIRAIAMHPNAEPPTEVQFVRNLWRCILDE